MKQKVFHIVVPLPSSLSPPPTAALPDAAREGQEAKQRQRQIGEIIIKEVMLVSYVVTFS